MNLSPTLKESLHTGSHSHQPTDDLTPNLLRVVCKQKGQQALRGHPRTKRVPTHVVSIQGLHSDVTNHAPMLVQHSTKSCCTAQFTFRHWSGLQTVSTQLASPLSSCRADGDEEHCNREQWETFTLALVRARCPSFAFADNHCTSLRSERGRERM